MPKPKSVLILAGLLLAGLSLARAAPSRAAPAPPDWTGIWTRVGSLNFDPTIPGAQPDAPPYNLAYAARFAAILEAEARGTPMNDKSAQCQPPGLVRMMNMVYPLEIIQTPGQVTLVAEWMGQVRRVFTDGRPHPVDPDPTFNGHSIGRWEGQVLVIDTVGLKGGGILDDHGAPLGEVLHVTERLYQEGPDTLKDEFTIFSEDAMTRPYTATKTFRRNRDIQMMEYVCEENNRNPVDANGVTGVILQRK